MVGKSKKKAGNETAPRRAAATPKLLSGGNPQIAKADGNAPVKAYIAAMQGWIHHIVRGVSDVRKAVRWNSPFYGIEGNGWFLSYHGFTNYVNVTFFRGMALRPLPPAESKHDEVRYFHIHENETLDEELMASRIRQASERRGDALV